MIMEPTITHADKRSAVASYHKQAKSQSEQKDLNVNSFSFYYPGLAI